MICPINITTGGNAFLQCDGKSYIYGLRLKSATLSIQSVPTLMCISGNGFVQSSEDNAE